MNGKKSSWALEDSIRKQFVALYQQQNKINIATQHCLELGRRQPTHLSTSPRTAYSPSTEFPDKALAFDSEGKVEFTFTVTQHGFVVNPKVVKADHELFINNAKETVSKARYVPRMENGKFVATQCVTKVVRFRIKK